MSFSKLQKFAAAAFAFTSIVLLVGISLAQFGRRHTATKARGLTKVPANVPPRGANYVAIQVEGDQRVIRSNGIPDHKTGQFPNSGNPHHIEAQQYVYRVPARPEVAARPTQLGMGGSFGVAINGVPFDPGAAEFFNGQMGSRWQYEPLSGAIALGIDASHAHVQPSGAYHYHGLPDGLLDNVHLDPEAHSPLIGWAADGFPIYAMYGYQDSEQESKIVSLRSSYKLRQGMRPGGREPTGKYDGTFVADYEYVEGSGDLDECNGRHTVTPEFPAGTYAYFLTEQWPVIPRNFRGTPSDDFMKRGGPPGMESRGRPPGRGFGPPRRPRPPGQ